MWFVCGVGLRLDSKSNTSLAAQGTDKHQMGTAKLTPISSALQDA